MKTSGSFNKTGQNAALLAAFVAGSAALIVGKTGIMYAGNKAYNIAAYSGSGMMNAGKWAGNIIKRSIPAAMITAPTFVLAEHKLKKTDPLKNHKRLLCSMVIAAGIGTLLTPTLSSVMLKKKVGYKASLAYSLPISLATLLMWRRPGGGAGLSLNVKGTKKPLGGGGGGGGKITLKPSSNGKESPMPSPQKSVETKQNETSSLMGDLSGLLAGRVILPPPASASPYKTSSKENGEDNEVSL